MQTLSRGSFASPLIENINTIQYCNKENNTLMGDHYCVAVMKLTGYTSVFFVRNLMYLIF